MPDNTVNVGPGVKHYTAPQPNTAAAPAPAALETAPPAPTPPVQPAPQPETKKVEELLSTKFAKLQEEDARRKSEWAKYQSDIDTAKKIQEARQKIADNPLAIYELFPEVDFDKLMLAESKRLKESPDSNVKAEMQSEIAKLRKEQADQQAAFENQYRERAVTSWKSSMEKTILAGDDFELINTLGLQSQVFDRLQANIRNSGASDSEWIRALGVTNEEEAYRQAATQIESELEESYKRFTNTKKFKGQQPATVVETPEVKTEAAPQPEKVTTPTGPTLSQNNTARIPPAERATWSEAEARQDMLRKMDAVMPKHRPNESITEYYERLQREKNKR